MASHSEVKNQHESNRSINNKNKKRLFYIIAFVLPVVILMGIEGLLRLSGIGERPPVFVESPVSKQYLMPNPALIERYFSHPELAPDVSPDTVYFKKDKPADLFRIVIQGGSSAAGFPFGRFGSLQGMLEQRLKDAYPDANFEIINTAMAAVNTFTLLDIQDEILALEPDAVLIYSGHNEYLGVLGAGSVFSSSWTANGSYGATLLYLKLKSLNLFNSLESLYAKWFVVPKVKELEQADSTNARSTMAKAAQGQTIEFDSETYHQGLLQFENNLSLILDKYKKANVNVLLGNLASIEKGLAPFSSFDDGDKAGAVYQQAEIKYKNNELQAAKALYAKAKDLDTLRFRAPTEFNDIVAKLVTDYANLSAQRANNTVQLVNVEKAFRQANPQSVLTTDLFLEHVHPTRQGYFVLADAFFEQLQSVLPFDSPSADRLQSGRQAMMWMPITDLSDAYAKLKIYQLTKDYPFVKQNKSIIELGIPLNQGGLPELSLSKKMAELLSQRLKGQDWWQLQKQLQAHYIATKQIEKAAIVAGIMADAMPMSADAQNTAARLFRQTSAIRLARFHQHKALQADPDNIDYLLNYAFDMYVDKQPEQSLMILNKAKNLVETGQIKSRQNEYKERIGFFINKVQQSI